MSDNTMMINISGYKFVALENLPTLREHLLGHCQAVGLKGTILLAPEGINIFLSGDRSQIDGFSDFLKTLHAGFADLTFKESPSDHQPFRRMLVRLKKEIISMGVPSVQPEKHPSPRLSPQKLKEWLDEQKDFILLDTRNDYEVRLGSFDKAQVFDLKTFRAFPEVVRSLDPEWKNKPVVTFCTGGIRCEKAAPLLEQEGFQEVYQLDGGILKYFEECGNAHYHGDCFVFDGRVAVDAQLQADNAMRMCFACRNPLTPAEQRDERYVVNISCPHCFGRHASADKTVARPVNMTT